MAADAVLVLDRLSSERDDVPLFTELSVTMGAGDVVQLAGPNGSGKTTLLRILMGLSSQYQGNISWRGTAMPKGRVEFLADTLYLGHNAGVKAALTPLENLRWTGALCSPVDDNAIFAALEKVGLAGYEHQPCYALSAGQQRRVSLARLFCSSASLWVLDEPFTAIDLAGVAEIESWIDQHAESGGMVLLTTHHRLSLSRPPRVLSLEAQ